MKYTGKFTKEISFPIGGIGTGSIGLDGDGRLIDWEIFNRPSKGGFSNGYSHFSIRAIDNGTITPMVMNGEIKKDYIGHHTGYGHGPDTTKMFGHPHFRNVQFNGEFPVAEIDFNDDKFPADVKMTAFNPFIPRDAKNSSIPAAFFEIEVINTADKQMTYQVAFSAANPYSRSVNKASKKDNCTMITMYNAGADEDSVEYGDLTIATDCEKAYTQTYWYRGKWMDHVVSFWNDFSLDSGWHERHYDTAGDTPGGYDTCTIVADAELCPGETKKLKFILSWNVPNNYNYWNECKNEYGTHKTWKNYYATLFRNSKESALYSLANWDDLFKRTMQFKNTLYSSSLPECVIDAAGANLSVLKSPTVLRLEDGSFYGWEGCRENTGSCEGTCQHVWNYAYALCFLFPELERSIRDVEFRYSTAADGRMGFRTQLPLGRGIYDHRACVDGQMGSVIKCYREWKISGDNKWLRDNWQNIKKILEYAWSSENYDRWDADKDGVLEGRQHHTLDMELFGPSSWLEGMYLAALKAAAEMAEFLGDTAKEAEYRELFEKGCKWTKENLFNGKYFYHKIDIDDKSIPDSFDASQVYWNDETKQIKYQVGEGSVIDQMLGQWHADITGLGDIFDKEQISTALSSMMENNFKSTMRDFVNPWRIFSVGDEAGTVICDYPDSAQKPKIPISYCEETMTGFEYAFAGLLCSRGNTDDGFKVVKAIRDRYDGEKRNPWNEIECGSNYARSMASYALIPILSGFEFDMPNGHMGFNPYTTGDFKCIWSLADAWGNFEKHGDTTHISIYEGSLKLKSLGAAYCKEISAVKIDGKDIDFLDKNGRIYFEETIINKGVEINEKP